MSCSAPDCLVIGGPWLGAKVSPVFRWNHKNRVPKLCIVVDGDKAGERVVLNPTDLKPIVKLEAKT